MATDEVLAPYPEKLAQVFLENPTVEVWRGIAGYEGHYMVSRFGRVKSLTRVVADNRKTITRKSRILSARVTKTQREKIALFVETEREDFFVHRLVALAFHGEPPEGYQVNHIDGNPRNNHSNNLEWVNSSYNQKHAWALGLKNQDGEKNPSSKLKDADVYKIRGLLKEGHSDKYISEMFNMSRNAIYRIKTKSTWKHLAVNNG